MVRRQAGRGAGSETGRGEDVKKIMRWKGGDKRGRSKRKGYQNCGGEEKNAGKRKKTEMVWSKSEAQKVS